MKNTLQEWQIVVNIDTNNEDTEGSKKETTLKELNFAGTKFHGIKFRGRPTSFLNFADGLTK